jgi:Spy/CpxP family protein refolding chaperone
MKAAMATYFEALTAADPDSAALAQAQEAIIALEKEHVESRFALENSIVALLSTDEATQLGQCLISLPERPVDPPNFDNETKNK